jgi:long-chain acyl-CoA synthetase
MFMAIRSIHVTLKTRSDRTPNVIDVAVVGVSDSARGQVPKAYVVLTRGTDLSEVDLQAFLTDKLSPIEIPHIFEFRRDLPKSAAGKVLKRAV